MHLIMAAHKVEWGFGEQNKGARASGPLMIMRRARGPRSLYLPAVGGSSRNKLR